MNYLIDYDNITNNSNSKIKLDDIIEAIKLIKPDFQFIQEIRTAIKALKRYKQIESSKW
jgi:hypothetical protein